MHRTGQPRRALQLDKIRRMMGRAPRNTLSRFKSQSKSTVRHKSSKTMHVDFINYFHSNPALKGNFPDCLERITELKLFLANNDLPASRRGALMTFFTKVSKQFPDQAFLQICLGRLHKVGRIYQRAVHCFSRASELAPAEAFPQICLGNTRMSQSQKGKYPELLSLARQHYKAAQLRATCKKDLAAIQLKIDDINRHLPPQKTEHKATTLLHQYHRHLKLS